MSNIRTTSPFCLQMHHQGGVQSHCITPSVQGFTVSPNYMKLQSSEWPSPQEGSWTSSTWVPVGLRKPSSIVLSLWGLAQHLQFHTHSIANVAVSMPLTYHRRAHCGAVWAGAFCKVSSSLLTGYQAESSHNVCSSYQSRVRRGVPKRRRESGFRAYLLQQSCQRREHSLGGDVFICACLHETKWEQITAG